MAALVTIGYTTYIYDGSIDALAKTLGGLVKADETYVSGTGYVYAPTGENLNVEVKIGGTGIVTPKELAKLKAEKEAAEAATEE